MKMKPNVVNFHFIDHCNYSCCYCFVKKENKMANLKDCKIIIDNIADYFSSMEVKGRVIHYLILGEAVIIRLLDGVKQFFIDWCEMNLDESYEEVKWNY